MSTNKIKAAGFFLVELWVSWLVRVFSVIMLLVRLGAWVVLLLAVGGLALGAGRHCVLFSYIKLEICIAQPLWASTVFNFGSSAAYIHRRVLQ